MAEKISLQQKQFILTSGLRGFGPRYLAFVQSLWRQRAMVKSMLWIKALWNMESKTGKQLQSGSAQ